MTNGSTEIERYQSTGSLRCLNRTGARMRSRKISKLDFPPLGGIAEQVAQVIRKGGVDFCHLGVSRGGSKSHLGPQMTPHQGERITEGRGAFVIPRGVADGEGLGMGISSIRQAQRRARTFTICPLLERTGSR